VPTWLCRTLPTLPTTMHDQGSRPLFHSAHHGNSLLTHSTTDERLRTAWALKQPSTIVGSQRLRPPAGDAACIGPLEPVADGDGDEVQ
jgi:hypothetical protein